jgi:hypothetical protein
MGAEAGVKAEGVGGREFGAFAAGGAARLRAIDDAG